MKKLYLLLLVVLFIPFMGNAQFSEDFESTTGGVLPAGWEIYNEDGLTPNAEMGFPAFLTDAWILLSNSITGNTLVASTSYYSSPGQSDDWLVTPQITVPTTAPFLLFDAMAANQDYADDYEVLISTTGNTPSDFSTVVHSETSPPETFETVAVDLSAYAGQEVYVAFRNVANDELLLYLDNVEVLTLSEDDVAIVGVEVNPYSEINTDNNLMVTIKNMGANLISSVDIEWTDGTDTYTHSATGLSLSPYASTTITHSTPVNYSSVVEKQISTTALNVNSGTDPNLTDNTGEDKFFRTVSQIATKYVVVEEGTGTWCGYCPRGIVAMEYMYDNPALFPNFIGIAVHNQDPMMVPEYDGGADFSGWPGSNIGRVIMGTGVNKNVWEDFYNSRKDIMAPAEIAITVNYDETTREITAAVSADFYTNFSQTDMRFAVVVVEDGVTGTSSGYAQVNYYSDSFAQDQGTLPGFDDLPNPVPASQMVYDRVGIALLGGYDGEVGSVPSALNDGDTANYTFTYTLPASSDPAEVALVALLIDNNTGAILNANEVQLDGLGIAKNPIALDNIEMYPNPASDFIHVSFGMQSSNDVRLNIYSMTGAVVQTQSFENLNGNQEMQVDISGLSAGQYLVSLATDEGAVVKKIVVE